MERSRKAGQNPQMVVAPIEEEEEEEEEEKEEEEEEEEAQFCSVYLFLFSTCFRQPYAHHQTNSSVA